MGPPAGPAFCIGERVRLPAEPGLVHIVRSCVWSLDGKRRMYKLDVGARTVPESELAAAGPPDDASEQVGAGELDRSWLRGEGCNLDGDVSYDVGRCPACSTIYLLEVIDDLVWLLPGAEGRDAAAGCGCGRPLDGGLLRPTFAELARSPWRGLTLRTRES